MGKIIAGSLGALVGLVALMYGLTWIGLIGSRPIQKYQTETDKQVYDTSRQYQQGTVLDIARYCETMRTTKEEASRKAVAALIRSTADTYNGPLPQDDTDCINEARGL